MGFMIDWYTKIYLPFESVPAEGTQRESELLGIRIRPIPKIDVRGYRVVAEYPCTTDTL